ncbi:NmrA/HSCARG family protein, partial [bacterium]
GDLRDRASLDAALVDVRSVFYMAPAFQPDEVELGLGMVAAAKRAGVRRFVFSSVIHPVLRTLTNHAAKAPVEEAVLSSGLEYVFLHPAVFFQNLARSFPEVVRTGVLAEPWSNDTRLSRVDYRDVAEVAAMALTDARLLYGTYELCAEGNLDRHDVAGLLGEVLGRPIEARRAPPPTPSQERPTEAQNGVRKMAAWYDAHALLGNPLTLRAILGREPRSLAAYLGELAASRDAELERDTRA